MEWHVARERLVESIKKELRDSTDAPEKHSGSGGDDGSDGSGGSCTSESPCGNFWQLPSLSLLLYCGCIYYSVPHSDVRLWCGYGVAALCAYMYVACQSFHCSLTTA